MAYPIFPPPTDDDLAEFFVGWLAKRSRAKVSLTIYKSDSLHHTLTIDGRSPENAQEKPSER